MFVCSVCNPEVQPGYGVTFARCQEHANPNPNPTNRKPTRSIYKYRDLGMAELDKE